MRATIRYGVLPPVPPGPRQFGYRMSPIGTFEPSTDVRSTAAFGGDPELGRMIAYRLQERAFGGLDREGLRFLHGLARHGGPPWRRLKPGTVLVRAYQGQRHTVTVVSDGFDWQGATYASLSAIARAITGTAWSGPRFFALARGNGAPARRNKNASAREGRDGSQPARGMNASEMNTASLPLQTASHA